MGKTLEETRMNFLQILNITHPTCSFTITNPDDYSTIVWDSENTYPLPDEDYLVEWGLRITSDYAIYRKKAYPDIGDQLDALWKGGSAAEDMKAQVQTVKDTYPKPE